MKESNLTNWNLCVESVSANLVNAVFFLAVERSTKKRTIEPASHVHSIDQTCPRGARSTCSVPQLVAQRSKSHCAIVIDIFSCVLKSVAVAVR